MARKSKYAEMVEAEAEAVEAAEGAEPEPEPEPETEPEATEPEAEPAEPEPEPEPEPMSAEARAAAVESIVGMYMDALRSLFGDELDEGENCPLCGPPGVVWPEGIVLDNTTQRCGRCKGHGQIATESQVPTNVYRQCPDCNGNGYVPRLEPVQASPNFNPPNGQANEPAAVVIPPMPVYDVATNSWKLPDGQTVGA